MPLWVDLEDDDFDPDQCCPKCRVPNIDCIGADTILNLGGEKLLTRIEWFMCFTCGHKWSDSYDYNLINELNKE